MGGRVVTHCARGSKVAGSTTPRRPATLPPRDPATLRHGLTSPMATAPPFAAASQRPPLLPRFPSPRPAFVSSPPAASQIALPPSARTSIVHVPSRSQSSSTETSPSRALQRSRSPRQRVSPGSVEIRTRPPERDSLRPSLSPVVPPPSASCSAADCLSPCGCRSRSRARSSSARCSAETRFLWSDP
jgi:hypothetical protein